VYLKRPEVRFGLDECARTESAAANSREQPRTAIYSTFPSFVTSWLSGGGGTRRSPRCGSGTGPRERGAASAGHGGCGRGISDLLPRSTEGFFGSTLSNSGASCPHALARDGAPPALAAGCAALGDAARRVLAAQEVCQRCVVLPCHGRHGGKLAPELLAGCWLLCCCLSAVGCRLSAGYLTERRPRSVCLGGCWTVVQTT
jgi:hypothetical protein